MLSVIIITKNEAQNIRRCLESVSFADEIIVVDSGSSDTTVSIAHEFTSKVFIMTDWQGYGIQKQRALEKATGDWVLNLDADESLSEALQRDIQKAIATDKADAYRIPIQMCFYGKPLRYSSSPQRHIRLFKRAGAKYRDVIVHENIELPTTFRIAQLQNSIQHSSFRDVSHALTKTNQYSSYSAKIRIEKNQSSSFFKSIAAGVWMFLRCYLLQRGFLDGQAGFLMACFNAQGSFYKGIKQIYRDD